MDYLQPEEDVLHEEGRHPLSILDGLVGLTILIGILVALDLTVGSFLLGPRFAWLLLLPLGVLYVWGVLLLYWRVRTSRYVVTGDRVYRSHGRIRFRLLQTTYDKVTDLQVRQSLFGRIWGFGDITLQTAGTGLGMEGVRKPHATKRRIEAARVAFLDRLIEEHRLEAVARAPTGTPERTSDMSDEPDMDQGAAPDVVDGRGVRHDQGGDVVLWRGRPVFLSLVSGLVPAVIMGIVAISIGGTALATGQLPLLLGSAAFALFALVSVAAVIIQYNYTRYEVRPGGVVVTSGWLTRRRVETTYSKVTDVTTYQGIAGRLFNFGNITINTAGSNQAAVNFNGLGDPERVKRIIDEARKARNDRRGAR